MKRIVIAGLSSGLALFFWGFVSWVVLPWHNMTFRELPGEARVREVLRDEMKESGSYFIPWLHESQMTDAASTEKAMAEMTERHRQGPVVQVFYQVDGAEPMAPHVLLRGVIIDLLIGFVAAVMVGLTLDPTRGFSRRFGIVLATGLFTVLMTHVTDWNFMYRPLDYTLVMCADHLVGATIVGLIVAAIVRPTASSTTASSTAASSTAATSAASASAMTS